jgi:hypothetical protein
MCTTHRVPDACVAGAVLSLHFATHHPADGRALRYHFDEFMLEWVRALVARLSQHPFCETAYEDIPRDAVALYLEQLLAVELHLAGHEIFRARFAISQGAAADPVPVPTMLAGLIADSLAGSGVRVTSSAKLAWRRHSWRLRGKVRELISRGVRPTARLEPVAGSIAVELVEGADPGRKCDAFWLADGSIDPARVLFVVEPHNRNLVNVDENIAAVAALGARIVTVDPLMRRAGLAYWRPGALPAWSGRLRARLRQPGSGIERWLAQSLQRLAQRVGFWEAFFSDHGVQAVQQFTEFSDETVAKRIAIDRLGGIELGKQRSQFFERASAAFYFRHEAAFVWHRNAVPFLQSGDTRTRYAIETGYVYEHQIDTLRPEGAALRRRLADNGATTVMAVFDSQTHPNTHFSYEDLRQFYRAVLGLAAARPGLGLVIKSKKPGIIASLEQQAAALDALVAAGRCIIIDRPLTSMMPAALAADVAIGFPASTAACEAALAGCRVFMYDPSRSALHPWAAEGAQVMFDDIEAFTAAVARALDAAAAGAKGMPRARLLEVDPFLDRGAARRAGGFIDAFLSARSAGADKGAALAAALERSGGIVLDR